jgi:cytochrome bd-type quinol oxidase subunit 1
MRLMVGLIGLLLALAAVGMLVKTRLQLAHQADAPMAGAAASGVPLTALPEQMKHDVERALQQGAERASEAQP